MVTMARVVPNIEVETPFERITHSDALERFGIDRPDLRYSLEIQDWTEALGRLESPVLAAATQGGGRIRGLLLKGGGRLSRKRVEAIEGRAKDAGAPGLLWAKRSDDGGSGSLARFMDPSAYETLGMESGDLALVAAGEDRVTSSALAAARTAAVDELELPKNREHSWLWIVDFPIFEADDDGGLAANHHPFVRPHPEDVGLMEEHPDKVRGLAYDLVLNGVELGSGSIRNHDPIIQRQILRLLGLSDAEIDQKFGFLLQALLSGAPPHGGVALGVDRLVAQFVGAASLRDVIAFPKTTAARALYEGAPGPVTDADLSDLGLSLGPTPQGSEVGRAIE